MRRVLAPLRRCFADDGRRTRLRALYEDAALVRGSDAAVVGETDPTTLIADRKSADAARRLIRRSENGRLTLGAPYAERLQVSQLLISPYFSTILFFLSPPAR